MIYVLFNIGIIFWVFGITLWEGGNLDITPNYIYDNTKLNKPTCWFLFILLRLTSPIVTVYYIILLIGKAIWWLCTVGRKDEE